MSGDRSAADSLRLTNISAAHGKEISFRIDGNGVCRLHFVVYACEDLVLEKDAEFEISFPEDFLSSGGQVILRTRDVNVFLPTCYRNLVDPSGEISFPWLQNTKYPIAVWFYAVRRSLRKRDRPPWKTPPIILHKLLGRKSESGKFSTEGRYDASIDSIFDTTASRIMMISGAGRNQGRRGYMEDVDFSFDGIRVTDKRTISVFGVLDGHGGKDCAQFAADEVPTKMAALLRSGKSCQEAMFRSIVETDREFLRTSRSNGSGSTANVMLWDHFSETVYIANTADTRAVLSRSGVAYDLSIDRKASDAEEIARIAEAGGFVASGRLQGQLAVSRALGDAALKRDSRRMLIPDPEVSAFRPTAADEFIIIATDGLWDVMTSQAAVDMVRGSIGEVGLLDAQFSNGTWSASRISSELSRIADAVAIHAIRKLGSSDNVTVMIVRIIREPVDEGLALRSSSKSGRGLGTFTDDLDDDGDGGKRGSPADWEEFMDFWNGSTTNLCNSSSESNSGKRTTTSIPSESASAAIGSYGSQRATSFESASQSTFGRSQSVQAAQQSQSNSTGSRPGKGKEAEEDDLMDFLLDDSNF